MLHVDRVARKVQPVQDGGPAQYERGRRLACAWSPARDHLLLPLAWRGGQPVTVYQIALI